MDFVALLKANWTVVSQAPWAFVSLAIVFGGGGFTLGRFFLSEKVGNLQSRLEAREDKIKQLQQSNVDRRELDAGLRNSKRQHLLGQLMGRYVSRHPDISERMKMGLERPPADWINAELEKLNERWRVRDIGGDDYIIDEA